jgi:hypothetical protein
MFSERFVDCQNDGNAAAFARYVRLLPVDSLGRLDCGGVVPVTRVSRPRFAVNQEGDVKLVL